MNRAAGVAVATLLGWQNAAAAGKPCTSATVATCGPWGYCDESIGHCICAPGRDGPDCSQLRYPACRLHRDGEMACGTFVGPPSCACRLQCEALYGGMGRRTHDLCWRPNDSHVDTVAKARALAPDAELSDFPEDFESVEFRRIVWPTYANCDRPGLGASKKCDKRFGLATRRRTVRMLGGMPLPNRRCPLACSHRGTCLQPSLHRDGEPASRYPLAGGGEYCPDGPASCQPASARPAGQPACICHQGYRGEGCETVDASQCFNSCSHHGQCTGRFCLCDRGWQGLDCSLPVLRLLQAEAPAAHVVGVPVEAASAAASSGVNPSASVAAAALARPGPLRATRPQVAEAASAASWGSMASPSAAVATAISLKLSTPRPKITYAPTYIYPLPSALSMEYVYQRDQLRRGQYYANIRYLEQALQLVGSAVLPCLTTLPHPICPSGASSGLRFAPAQPRARPGHLGSSPRLQPPAPAAPQK